MSLVNFKDALSTLALVVALSTPGCGGSSSQAPATVSTANTKCGTGMTQLLVGDGFIQILCGCTLASEADGKIFYTSSGTSLGSSSGSSLTCHLARANTQVFFYYLGTTLKHQIVPVGTSSFPASPVSDPGSDSAIRVHSFSLNQAGTTFQFADAFNGLSGQIITP